MAKYNTKEKIPWLSKNMPLFWLFVLIGYLLALPLTLFVTNIIYQLKLLAISFLHAMSANDINQIQWPQLVSFFNAGSLTDTSLIHRSPFVFFIFMSATILGVSVLSYRLYRKYHLLNFNEYGNQRLTTLAELNQQYKKIPDRNERFDGIGGVPVAHLNNWRGTLLQWTLSNPIYQFAQKYSKGIEKLVTTWFEHGTTGWYFIDSETNNTETVGITRSGKGETEVMPTVDILSRAKTQCSMILNDPKGELYQMSYNTLRERNFDVLVLNLQNMGMSMSYNPLQIIINYAKRGYYDKVQQEINTLSTAIYVKPKSGGGGGNDAFWENSSVNLLNALILAQIDLARRTGDWGRVTMRNVVKMMTSLGGQQVFADNDGNIVDDPQDATRKVSKLILYFETFNEMKSDQIRSMALDAFQQSKFAGDETSGNIYSSAMEGIKLYQQTDIGKLTSKNSINFKQIGFPRFFEIQVPDAYKFHTATVIFRNLMGRTIEQRNQIVDDVGYINYALKAKLPNQFVCEIRFDYKTNPKTIRQDFAIFDGRKIFARKGMRGEGIIRDPYSGIPIIKKISLNLSDVKLAGSIGDINISYSEKPTALFLVTPPQNPAYNSLVSFMVDQSFNQLYEAAAVNGRKLFTRVHYILDEFGNLPAVPKMATKLSIGAGQGILFDIVLQNFEQAKINYSDDEATTIHSNCSNTMYILTKSKETAKQMSEGLGKRTVTVQTRNSSDGSLLNGSNNTTRIAQDILSEQEIMRFKGGEMLVERSTKRDDLKHRKVVPFPILDRGKTAMPYRWQFLKKTFNSDTTLSDIKIDSPHQRLDLKEIDIDYNREFELIRAEGEKNQSATPDEMDAVMRDVAQAARSEGVPEDQTPIFTSEQLENNEFMENAVNQLIRFITVKGREDAKDLDREIHDLSPDTFFSSQDHNRRDYLKRLLGDQMAAYLQQLSDQDDNDVA